MVTAEMMAAQVIGALEYRPDAYLGKPFTFEQLSVRIDRLIARNAVLGPVYRALDAGETDQALALCDDIIARAPTARYACLRIQSEILEQQQDYAAARDIYEKVAGEQPLLWAMIGIGRLLFGDGRVEEALAHFERLRESQPRQIGIIDWIARCREQLGELDKSEQALLEAVALSPKSVNRQARLGAIAERLAHHDIAHRAWARTINEGRHSCLVDGDNYRRYFDNTGRLLGGLEGRERGRALAETERTAKQMEAQLRHRPAELAVNHCALAGLFRDAGRSELSDRFVDKLAKTLDDPNCRLSDDDRGYIAGRLDGLDGSGKNEAVKSRIAERLCEMEQAAAERRQQDQVAREINQRGLALHRQKKPAQALEQFREAVATMPDNPTYLLNAAQMVLLDRELRNDTDLMREARGWMQRVSLARDDERMPLYLMLKGRLPNA